MASKHINRQATQRVSIPVTVCLTLLASCVSKPIEQDLASGDATVEIKYLDSMTVDIIDDIRMKRRNFYENALDNPKKYEQGIQGAVDRVSTFAAAINANAQRDKSVLDRYHAESDRQLSALENSEELGDAVLAQNKKYIEQMSTMNEYSLEERKSNLDARKAVNEAGADVARSAADAQKALVDLYKTQISELPTEIKNIESEIAEMEKNPAHTADLTKKRAEKTAKVDELAAAKAYLSGLNTTTSGKLGAVGTTGSTGLAGVIAGTGGSGSAGKIVDPGKITSNVTNIVGVPGVVGPTGKDYIQNAASALSAANSAVDNLAKSDRNTAINIASKLSAPPIERIRNDEAVFDYLLDGYRNTQVSSGAEYGGMVRRVLPFSFTFTPGNNTNSGFSARVLLRPDQQQLDEAAKMIAPHLNAVNQDRLAKYQNEIQIMQREAKEILTKTFIDQSYDKNCSVNDLKSGIKSKEFFEQQAFWNAYRVSIDAIRKSLQAKINDEVGDFIYGNNSYQYDMKNVVENIAEDAIGIMSTHESPHSDNDEDVKRAILELSSIPDAKYEYVASSSVCQLNKLMSGKLSMNKESVNNFIEKINSLAEAMTAAGLVYDLHLKANPLFFGNDKKVIEVVRDGVRYQAKIKEVSASDIKIPFVSSAAPRIVQNTSREYVVEIPDTTKINTLLSAGVTGNEVSSSLGLTAGAELALALSSSSAFMKRIPYAVPFTGQSFSLASSTKKACTDEQEKTECADDRAEKSCMCSYEGQSFGWKFYKTPSGVKQMGGIAQSFKTTVVNSAVVVSMPEWISKLEATYELSGDGGKTWRRVGGEKIALAGASLRGAFSSDAHSSFDTWVKYNLYREVDGSVGLPELKSCYNSTENIIYGSSKGYTALCGENLYGVKAVLVGGRYIDNIEKVSSSLIKVGNLGLGPDDCSSAGDCATNANSKCRVALLSDFGAHSGKNPFCLQFKFVDGLEPIDLSGLVKPNPATVVEKNVEITFSNVSDGKAMITNYTLPGGKQQQYANNKISITENDLLNICLENKQDPCFIPIYGTVKVGDQNLKGILYTINMNDDGLGLRLWQPYPKNRLGISNMMITEEGDYEVEISGGEKNKIFIPELISINGNQLPKANLTIGEGSHWKFKITKSERNKYCLSPNSSCSISISLKYTKAGWENIGTVTLPPEPPSSTAR